MKALWPRGKKLNFIGLSGPHKSGKSLWGCTIDPANTLVFDFEKSCGDYEALGFTRVDWPTMVLKKFGGRNYSKRQECSYLLSTFDKITPGKWSVIFLDPITDIESMIVEYVRANYADYGFASSETFTSSKGIFWGHANAAYKNILVELGSKCESLVWTSHMRNVWVGGKPTTAKEPKGKETLEELASLYLILDRTPPGPGQEEPDVPSAIVTQNRLTEINITNGCMKIVQCLPPRIPQCTPDAIREYIVNPRGSGDLRPDEIPQEKSLTDDERLLLETSRAEDVRAAAEAEAEATRSKLEVAKLNHDARSRLNPTAKPKDKPDPAPVKEPEAITEEQWKRMIDGLPGSVVTVVSDAAISIVLKKQPDFKISKTGDYVPLPSKMYEKFLGRIATLKEGDSQ